MRGGAALARGTDLRGALVPALTRNWRTLLWATPAVLALLYGIVVLVEFRSIIEQVYSSSDSAAAVVLAHLAGEAPSGAQVVLGNHAYYEEYLFLRWTSGLPFYRQLWEVAPLLWSLFGLALLGWSVWRAFGRFAAVLVSSALACVGAFGRLVFFTFDWHGLSAVHTIVIGAALVWLTPRAASLGWWRLAGLAVALGAVGILPAASDQLFLFWALIPLLVTCLAIAWRGAGPIRARMAVFGIVCAAVSLAGGALVAHEMRVGGVTAFPFGFTLVAASSVINNIVLTFESYMNIGGGDFFGAGPSLTAYSLFASGALVVAAFVAVLVEARRRAASAPPRPPGGDPLVGVRFAYVVYWTACLVTTTIVYISTSAPVDVNGGRYILGGYVAIGALLAPLAARGLGARLAVTACVCVFALSAIFQALEQTFTVGGATANSQQTNELLRYAQREHARYGYAGYWDAVELTWAMRFKAQVYPVYECNGATLCPFPTVHISTWYTTHPRARSFLIVNPTQFAPTVVSVDPALGSPIATTTIGTLTVYVFPYNIDTKLGG